MFELAQLLAGSSYMALGMGSDRDAKELSTARCHSRVSSIDPFTWLLLRDNAGLVALLTGDIDAAHEELREGLTLCRELVVPIFAFEGLLGLAAVAAARSDTQRAARLAGAAATHRDDAPPDEVEARVDAAFIQPARARYGTAAWDAAAHDGGTLGFEDAIAYALQWPDL